MNKVINRNYLEISSLSDLNESINPSESYSIELVKPTDFQLNKFFYKNNNDFAGFFELISHQDKNEIEIAYLGLLEEYQNKKLGSYLLSSAIKNSFLNKPDRVWVHTCSLDHKNALKNYLSRGMKVFKSETLTRQIS